MGVAAMLSHISSYIYLVNKYYEDNNGPCLTDEWKEMYLWSFIGIYLMRNCLFLFSIDT